MKRFNIKVQIVYPHEFDSPMVDDINTYRSPENKMMVNTIPTLSLDTVANAVMDGMENDKYEIIPGFMARAVARMNRWLPGLSRAIVDGRTK